MFVFILIQLANFALFINAAIWAFIAKEDVSFPLRPYATHTHKHTLYARSVCEIFQNKA